MNNENHDNNSSEHTNTNTTNNDNYNNDNTNNNDDNSTSRGSREQLTPDARARPGEAAPLQAPKRLRGEFDGLRSTRGKKQTLCCVRVRMYGVMACYAYRVCIWRDAVCVYVQM